MTKQADLSNFLLDYCAAFRPGDIPGVAKFYQLPVTMVFGGQVTILKTEEEIIATLQAIMNSLIAKNFKRSRVDQRHIHQLTENTALISASFSRLDTEDAILEQLGATYTVIDNGSGYKIAVLVAHDTHTVVARQVEP